MLLLSLAPVLSVFLAAIFLSERLTAVQTAGILITVGGIAWVVSDRNGNGSADVVNKKTFSTGIVFGLGAAVAQAVGLIASKRGLTGDLSSLSANLVRMTAAMIILWTYTLLRGQAGNTLTEISRANRSALFILLGSIAGPFFGVTFSMIALQNTQVGIASTLIALPPVLMLPIGYFAFHEHFGWRAVLGTLVAMGGVALLFLV
jgi:drug/metabolite transporter (DMT)-like permease